MSATPLPWQHDPIRTLAAAIAEGRSALDASDTGTGKTFQALFAAYVQGRSVSVVCPKSVKPAWAAACAAVGVEVLFVANIESLKSGRTPWLKREGKTGWRWNLPAGAVLIIDEVHRFSAPDSQNARILAAAPRPVLMLSATAAEDPTRMRAIASQLGLTSWREWWSWCGRNGCKRGYFGGIEFKGDAEDLDRLHRQVFHTGRGVRVRIADLGDAFPDNRLEVVSVPVEDQKALDEAYADELATLEASAKTALEASIRARQIAEHAKLPAIIELAQDLLESGNSVVIFCHFRDTLSRLAEQFPIAAVVHGDQEADEREAEVQRFQSDEAGIMVCMVQAGGVGLSLHDTHGNRPRVSLVFPGWSARELRQALGRIHRAGAKSKAIQKIIFAADTIEERIREKVERKLERIDLLNDGDLTPNTQTPMTNDTNTRPLEVPPRRHRSTSGNGLQAPVQNGGGGLRQGELSTPTLHNRPEQAADRRLPDAGGGAGVAPIHPEHPRSGGVPCRDGAAGTAAGPQRTREGLNASVRTPAGPRLLPELSGGGPGRGEPMPNVQPAPRVSLAPSRLKSLELCPGFRDDKRDPHPDTVRGTQCHEALESGNFGSLDEEQKAWAEMCAQFVRDARAALPGCQELRELELEIPGGARGFADCVLLAERHATLIDYKFGANAQEDAETNPAAQAYALALLVRWPSLEAVQVYYIYPRREEISSAIYTRKDIPRLRLRLETVAARVELGAERNPSPEVCSYCQHKATCRELHNSVLPIATRYAAAHEMAFPAVGDFSVVKRPEDWARLLAVAPVLEAMSDSIKRHALEFRQQQGVEIPGYELRSRQGRKTINNPLIAWETAKEFGLTQDQFLSAVDVSAKRLADAAGESAPRGQKAKKAAELEGLLRDKGALEFGAEAFYLARSKK